MPASPIKVGEPYSEAETRRIIEQFHHDGYFFFGPILDQEEVGALKDAMIRKLNDPAIREDDEAGDHIRGIGLMRMFEYDVAFRDLIAREPFASLAEALLGADCHLMSQNALHNQPNTSLKADGPGGWHVDDVLFWPLPDDIRRHDQRLTPPCFVINLLIPLTDVETVDYGPTQVVPGSHLSGRQPVSQDHPTFEGQGPISLLTKAGGAYFFNNQIWHRGAPNVSDRTRYLGGVTYSRRVIAQRLYPFIDYRMPAHVWDGADARVQRLLGRHPKGAYG